MGERRMAGTLATCRWPSTFDNVIITGFTASERATSRAHSAIRPAGMGSRLPIGEVVDSSTSWRWPAATGPTHDIFRRWRRRTF